MNIEAETLYLQTKMNAEENRTLNDPPLPPDPRPDPRRIVAELTRTWVNGQENVQGIDPSQPLISAQFEQMIDHNEKRGYILESWKFFQVPVYPPPISPFPPGMYMTETIIAVFRRKTG